MQKKLLGMLSLTFFFEIVPTENTSYAYVSVMVILYSTGWHVWFFNALCGFVI